MDVLLEAANMTCGVCGDKYNPTVAGWIVELENGAPSGYKCPPCAEKHGVKAGSIRLEAPGELAFRFLAPLSGNFKPVKGLREIEEFRSAGELGRSWWELESETLDALNLPYPILKFSIKNRSYKELWVSFIWENHQVIGLAFAGDRPSKGQELSIHQRFRLSSMGLVESESKNSDWSIRFSSEELSPENISRVVSHVLQFGYFLEPHKNGGLGMTVDTDALRPGFKDPNVLDEDGKEIPNVKPENEAPKPPGLAGPEEVSPAYQKDFKLETSVPGEFANWGVVDDLIRDLVLANLPKSAELRCVVKDQGVVVFEISQQKGGWLITVDHDHWTGNKLGADYNKAMLAMGWKAPNEKQGLFHGLSDDSNLAGIIGDHLEKAHGLPSTQLVSIHVAVTGRNYSSER